MTHSPRYSRPNSSQSSYRNTESLPAPVLSVPIVVEYMGATHAPSRDSGIGGPSPPAKVAGYRVAAPQLDAPSRSICSAAIGSCRSQKGCCSTGSSSCAGCATDSTPGPPPICPELMSRELGHQSTSASGAGRPSPFPPPHTRPRRDRGP